MEFITFMVNLAWSLLKITIAFAAFWLVFGRGRKVLKMVCGTISNAMQVLCVKIQKLLVKSLEKEKAAIDGDGEETGEVEFTVEASIK